MLDLLILGEIKCGAHLILRRPFHFFFFFLGRTIGAIDETLFDSVKNPRRDKRAVVFERARERKRERGLSIRADIFLKQPWPSAKVSRTRVSTRTTGVHDSSRRERVARAWLFLLALFSIDQIFTREISFSLNTSSTGVKHTSRVRNVNLSRWSDAWFRSLVTVREPVASATG